MSTLYGVTHFFVLAYLVDPSTDNVCSLANLKFFFSTMYLPLWATVRFRCLLLRCSVSYWSFTDNPHTNAR